MSHIFAWCINSEIGLLQCLPCVLIDWIKSDRQNKTDILLCMFMQALMSAAVASRTRHHSSLKMRLHLEWRVVACHVLIRRRILPRWYTTRNRLQLLLRATSHHGSQHWTDQQSLRWRKQLLIWRGQNWVWSYVQQFSTSDLLLNSH